MLPKGKRKGDGRKSVEVEMSKPRKGKSGNGKVNVNCISISRKKLFFNPNFKGKRKRKRRTDGETSEEELTRPKQKPFKPEDQHFYPTPRTLFKKRCVFTAESKPVACTSKSAVCLLF